MRDSIMEGQDEFIMHKSDNVEVGLGDNQITSYALYIKGPVTLHGSRRISSSAA